MAVTNLQVAQQISFLSNFTDWKVKFQKAYENQDEEEIRFKNFQRNLNFINNHNSRFSEGKESYFVGLNRLADLTREEITAIFLTEFEEDIEKPNFLSAGSCKYLYQPDTSWSEQTNCPGCYKGLKIKKISSKNMLSTCSRLGIYKFTRQLLDVYL